MSTRKENTQSIERARRQVSRALSKAEDARDMEEEWSAMDADTIPSIIRDLKSALRNMEQPEANAPEELCLPGKFEAYSAWPKENIKAGEMLDLTICIPKVGDLVAIKVFEEPLRILCVRLLKLDKAGNVQFVNRTDKTERLEAGKYFMLGKLSKPRKRRAQTSKPQNNDNARRLQELRGQLAKLELLPENESVRFKLETDIYRLEHEALAEDDNILNADLIGECAR